jgi:hypothetical protein
LNLQVQLGGSILEWAGSSAYELLVALIPTVGKRMPEYEFFGFPSKEAYDNGNYDEEADDSPTIPEIANAFEVAIRVNKFDLLSVIKNIIDPKELRSPISKRIAEAISRGSQNSQQQNGTSPLMSSMTSPPTSTENGVSPSPDLTSSSEGMSSGEAEN